ncbi:HNH endonuclease [Halomonas sp. I1]|uniref:HNH endonuclease n=1 Tax=Halomonas sp. I1 TaxID=393536 RepID=UPI0028DFFC05|nr:HNH endonuclease [Halomonas sp. I1]MDT8894037.1 HNH endonuclease [Halomonas sp. I1]
MPTITECIYKSQVIDVERALEIKKYSLESENSDADFTCIECGAPVRPHRDGGHASAHFEHLARNPECSLSHRAKGANEQGVLEPVESINEAQVNAQAFSGVGKAAKTVANENFNRFFHWYYFPELDLFAPSKFIGYKNTNLDNYKGKGTGTETQRVLGQWFSKVEAGTESHKELSRKLTDFAESIDKTISKKTFEGTGGVYILSGEYADQDFPDEITKSSFKEGATKQVRVNAYERSNQARAECIEYYGAKCCVCDFEFQSLYGKELGAGFIHVHHLVDISQIGKEYEVDPIADLRPVCPNCHAMLHKRKPAMHPEELRKIVKEGA